MIKPTGKLYPSFRKGNKFWYERSRRRRVNFSIFFFYYYERRSDKSDDA